jgi:hypothetical protein
MIQLSGEQVMNLIDGENKMNDFIQVKEEALWTTDGYGTWNNHAPKHKAIVEEDTGRIISVVGKGYNLVQNSEIIPQYEDAIARSNLNTAGMYRDIQYSHDGARTIVSYTFPAHRIAVKEGDEMDLKITVLNSYDGSWKFMSLVGAFRLLCTNGQIIGDSFSSYYGKHTKSLDVEYAISKLENSLEVYLHNAELWKQYPTSKITIQQANNILLTLSDGNEKMMELLNSTYQKYVFEMGHNLWALFNTLTDWSTHADVRNESNKSATVIGREQRVRKVLPMLDELRMAA